MSTNKIEDAAALLCRVMTSLDSACEALLWWTGRQPSGTQGEPTLHIETLGLQARQLWGAEYSKLDGFHNLRAWERHGLLSAGLSGPVLALTTALILPRRLPRTVRVDTGLFDVEDDREPVAPTGVPLGEALAARYVDVKRVDATATPVFGHYDASGAPLAVRCTAVLVVDDRPAALVREDLTMELLMAFVPPADLVDAFSPPTPGRPAPRAPTEDPVVPRPSRTTWTRRPADARVAATPATMTP